MQALEELSGKPYKEVVTSLSVSSSLALAARCVFRAMPASGARRRFPFVAAKPERLVEDIEIAVTVAALASMEDVEPSEAQAAAEAANYTTDATVEEGGACGAVAKAAARAAKAARSAIAGEAEAAKATAVGAVAAAVGAANMVGDVEVGERALRLDIEALLKLSPTGKEDRHVIQDFFRRPLWPGGDVPKKWSGVIENWRFALEEIERVDIYDRHLQMVRGKGLDWAEARERVSEWASRMRPRIKEREVSPTASEASVGRRAGRRAMASRR